MLLPESASSARSLRGTDRNLTSRPQDPGGLRARHRRGWDWALGRRVRRVRVGRAFDGTTVTGRDEASICGALRTDLSVVHEKGAVGVVVSLDEADGAGA
jgi:hypothetical protein